MMYRWQKNSTAGFFNSRWQISSVSRRPKSNSHILCFMVEEMHTGTVIQKSAPLKKHKNTKHIFFNTAEVVHWFLHWIFIRSIKHDVLFALLLKPLQPVIPSLCLVVLNLCAECPVWIRVISSKFFETPTNHVFFQKKIGWDFKPINVWRLQFGYL